MASYDLQGKVAFVTGAARGIGFATAQALRSRGASVTVVDLDREATAEAARRLGDGVLGVAADVTDRSALEAAVEATVQRFGGLDVCVANAGTVNRAATVRVMEPEAFERVIAVNVLGAYNTVYAALPQIVERKGHVAIVSSIYAFTNGLLVSPYAASKAAVEQFGRALRVELAAHGASATVVYYGFIATEMVKQGFEQDPVARALEHDVIPGPLRLTLTPEQAAEALVRGIERRSARVIAPKRWAALSTMRGIVNPVIDAVAARHPKLRKLIGQADVPGRMAGDQLIGAARRENSP